MKKRNFRLAPPDRITGELFDRGRDVNGNPTAHYALYWDNGLRGHDWQGDYYVTRRRAQVGYSDKITDGARGLASDLFPGTRWRVRPDSIEESQSGEAIFDLVRDIAAEPVPVIFRKELVSLGNWHTVAVFPTIPASQDGLDVLIFAHFGQHSAANHGWYTKTKPASFDGAARLRSELESAPYRYQLQPVKRWTKTHNAQRFEEARAQRDRARAVTAEKEKGRLHPSGNPGG